MAEKLHRWLEKVQDRRIKREFDNFVLIIGDEGVGKSNLIVGLLWWWQMLRGRTPEVDPTLDRLVYNKDEFKAAMANWEKRAGIGAMDAARILYKKDAMNPEQKELEKDLLDVRTKEHLVLLGFQEWDIVPTSLQNRRAQHCLRIPSRGVVHGYSRKTMDKIDGIEDEGDWPEPDMVDTFPFLGNLDGEIGDCWAAFKERDLERKKQRLNGGEGEEESDEPVGPKGVAEEIAAGDVSYYLSENKNTGELYVDEDIIALEFEHLSVREARQARKVLERKPDIQRITGEQETEAVA